MTKAFKTVNTRIYRTQNLAILVFFVICSCSGKHETDITIIWKNNKASGVSLSKSLFTPEQLDSLNLYLRISLSADADSTAILGDLLTKGPIVFEPLLPFSRGSVYSISFKNKKIGEFIIPSEEIADPPRVLACYPRLDSLPENLLKMYLVFSQPMSEGFSGKYISVINGADTLHDVFLNLTPELWNEDRTIITIWLDPGRIKRDLQPNLRLGSPLKKGKKYRLLVSHDWKDARGISMITDFTKLFVAGPRDSISPDPKHWKLNLPEKNTNKALDIFIDEAVDHFLLLECLYIKNDDGGIVKGTLQVDSTDKIYSFLPAASWSAGNYSLVIESRLEDLAGNNLNRPFDRDITTTKLAEPRKEYVVKFQMK